MKKNEDDNLSGSVRIGAAYIRVSTDDQLEYSPESQLDEIQLYCQRNNILLSQEHIFIEEDGRSGRKTKNREAFQRMIANARLKPKPFDVIVVWKYSRFARNQDESTFYKSMLRKKLEIDVVSISEPILDGMYGRLIEMIIEWQDEFYSVNLSSEVTRSMKSKARKGLYNGKMPLGYSKKPNELPVIVESEAFIVRMIFQMFTSGYDRNYITRYLNEQGYKTRSGKKFDSETVTYILENPFYIGKVRWNRRKSSGTSRLNDESEWIIADSHHDPLVDDDTWNLVQVKLAESKKIHSKYSHPVSNGRHWLSGMVKCSICGKTLTYKTGYNKDGINRCAGFQCAGYKLGLHRGSQFISETKLTASVIESLMNVLSSEAEITYDLISAMNTDLNVERQHYQKELDSLIPKEKRIKDAYIDGIDSLDEYKRNRIIIENRRKDLISKLSGLDSENLDSDKHKELFLSNIRSLIDIIKTETAYELKGEALRSTVKKIIFYKDTQTLEFHYFLSI